MTKEQKGGKMSEVKELVYKLKSIWHKNDYPEVWEKMAEFVIGYHKASPAILSRSRPSWHLE